MKGVLFGFVLFPFLVLAQHSGLSDSCLVNNKINVDCLIKSYNISNKWVKNRLITSEGWDVERSEPFANRNKLIFGFSPIAYNLNWDNPNSFGLQAKLTWDIHKNFLTTFEIEKAYADRWDEKEGPESEFQIVGSPINGSKARLVYEFGLKYFVFSKERPRLYILKKSVGGDYGGQVELARQTGIAGVQRGFAFSVENLAEQFRFYQEGFTELGSDSVRISSRDSYPHRSFHNMTVLKFGIISRIKRDLIYNHPEYKQVKHVGNGHVSLSLLFGMPQSISNFEMYNGVSMAEYQISDDFNPFGIEFEWEMNGLKVIGPVGAGLKFKAGSAPSYHSLQSDLFANLYLRGAIFILLSSDKKY